jgi:hypothetical protein
LDYNSKFSKPLFDRYPRKVGMIKKSHATVSLTDREKETMRENSAGVAGGNSCTPS